MNYRRRAENALRRVLAPHLHMSDLFELLALEFEHQLRTTARDAYRIGIRRAANTGAEHHGRSKGEVIDAVLALEKQQP